MFITKKLIKKWLNKKKIVFMYFVSKLIYNYAFFENFLKRFSFFYKLTFSSILQTIHSCSLTKNIQNIIFALLRLFLKNF